MISLEVPQERALLAGAPGKDIEPDVAADHLEELARLADTAGAIVVGTLRQRLDAPHPKYYIGEGKALELRERVHETGASLVIFDEQLSPAQGKNLETLLGARVMDRSELILDIFATRARTAEAKMQVELAQLEYMLPRLKRMWTHLSRIGGGIGLRGPGETQLETDRRSSSRRIRELRSKLEVVARRRATQRKARAKESASRSSATPTPASHSVLRALRARRPGRGPPVRDARPRGPARRAGGGRAILITDTVGFIRKLPHHLVASFRATLEAALEADLLLHVMDASYAGWGRAKRVVEQVLVDLGVRHRRMVLLFNKVDRLTHDEESALRTRARAIFPQPALFSSTVEPDGLGELRERLVAEYRAAHPRVHLRIPAIDGEALAAIYREGEVLQREEHDSAIDLIARLPQPALGRLRRRAGIMVFDSP